MTPLAYYQEQCSKGVIVKDQQQLHVLQQLQNLIDDLLRESKKRSGLFSFLYQPKSVKGFYLWGGVGIGKTFMMDCFYHCIPFPQKRRMHFHQFMQFVHHELKKYQGKKNPLQIIAKELAKKTMLLCFDELFVSDITDAMLLGQLFRALLVNGVCIVATSNSAPDDLYKNGLQRKLFLPAIDLLKQHTTVIHISTHIDYRLRHLKTAGVYYTLSDPDANEKMHTAFTLLADGMPMADDLIEIMDRPIQIIKQAGSIIWFDFDVICSIPRSQQDYLAIAAKYDTVFISNVPIIPPNAKDRISLFIRLVDVLYDAHIRLVISAEDVVEKLYCDGYMSSEFTRTRSRLLEMQSEDYYSKRMANKHYKNHDVK